MTKWILVLALMAAPVTALAQDDDTEASDAGEGAEGAKGSKPAKGTKGDKPEKSDDEASEDEAPRPAKGTQKDPPAPEPEPEPTPAAADDNQSAPAGFAPEPPPKPNPLQLMFEAPPPPLRIELPHGFWLSPEADIQLWATLYDADDAARNDPIVIGDPDHREGFSIRRARLGLSAGLGDIASLRVAAGWQDRYHALDVRPTGPRLVEASFAFTPVQYVGITAGFTRVPFGRQQINGSMDLALHERAMISQEIAPAREPGLRIGGSMGPTGSAVMPEDAFSYEFGISNGSSDFTGDLDPEPRLTGRLQLNLFDAWAGRESRFLEVSPAALSIGGGVMHNRALEANTTSVGADIGLQVWRILLQGEIAWSRAVPTFDTEGIPELLATRTAFGWYAQMVVAPFPEWLEFAFRVEGYDDNLLLDDAGNRLDVAGGVNFMMMGGRLKLQLDFIHREELIDSAKTANDSLIMVLQARL